MPAVQMLPAADADTIHNVGLETSLSAPRNVVGLVLNVTGGTGGAYGFGCSGDALPRCIVCFLLAPPKSVVYQPPPPLVNDNTNALSPLSLSAAFRRDDRVSLFCNSRADSSLRFLFTSAIKRNLRQNRPRPL
jgi:hypothetical protein